MNIISAVMMGMGLLSNIIKIIPIFKGGTAEEKTQALSSATDSVVGGMAALSTGGQADTWNKAAQVLPQIKDLATNLMHLAESQGKSGPEKQAYVTGMVNAALLGLEQLSTGGQATTVHELTPAIKEFVNATVPVIFPKDLSAIENLQPAA